VRETVPAGAGAGVGVGPRPGGLQGPDTDSPSAHVIHIYVYSPLNI
jgi:hypothetical protein